MSSLADWGDGYVVQPIFNVSDEWGNETPIAGHFITFAPSVRAAETTARIHMAALLRRWGLDVKLEKG